MMYSENVSFHGKPEESRELISLHMVGVDDKAVILRSKNIHAHVRAT